MSYADIVKHNKEDPQKFTRQKHIEALRKKLIEKEKDEKYIIEKHLRENCPFKEGSIYKILDKSPGLFPLNGIYMFMSIQSKWKTPYVWSDGYDDQHGLVWSSSTNLEWEEKTQQDLDNFNSSDDSNTIGCGEFKVTRVS